MPHEIRIFGRASRVTNAVDSKSANRTPHRLIPFSARQQLPCGANPQFALKCVFDKNECTLRPSNLPDLENSHERC
jgi:hypothetical protein